MGGVEKVGGVEFFAIGTDRFLPLGKGMVTPKRDPLAGEIIGAAIRVHRALGPGLLESTYKRCLVYELHTAGFQAQTEVAIPVSYREVRIDFGFRVDLFVEGRIIVEIKSVERLIPIHTAQILTYLRLADADQALLMNFNAVTLKAGLKSFLRGSRYPAASEAG